jgi:hypothetical protein
VIVAALAVAAVVRHNVPDHFVGVVLDYSVSS